MERWHGDAHRARNPRFFIIMNVGMVLQELTLQVVFGLMDVLVLLMELLLLQELGIMDITLKMEICTGHICQTLLFVLQYQLGLVFPSSLLRLVAYEGLHGPPMGFCDPNDRDFPFVGMPPGTPSSY
ncbi:hypothetical protein Ancab_001476 [Ancistrocladus abbreviatus]